MNGMERCNKVCLMALMFLYDFKKNFAENQKKTCVPKVIKLC